MTISEKKREKRLGAVYIPPGVFGRMREKSSILVMCTVVEGDESPVGSGVGRVSRSPTGVGARLNVKFGLGAWRGRGRLDTGEGYHRARFPCRRGPLGWV